jgi:cell division protein FtsZ
MSCYLWPVRLVIVHLLFNLSYAFRIPLSHQVRSQKLLHRMQVAPNEYVEPENLTPAHCKIQVFGVGGGGGNAINRIMRSNDKLPGVQLWAVNTDAQALAGNLAAHKINIGKVSSKGLGAGGVPEMGRRAAEENREDIQSATRGTDLVFVTAGMGGGTGSGAAPIVAECAKESGALTIGVVTKPFCFEGRKRMRQVILELNCWWRYIIYSCS